MTIIKHDLPVKLFPKIFFTSRERFRSIGWVMLFFAVLASLTLPVVIVSKHYQWEITILYEAIIVIAATLICQLLIRKPISEITGKLNSDLIYNLKYGLLAGFILMVIPAVFLFAFGWVEWQTVKIKTGLFLKTTGTLALAAIAEELLFRGFIFQRFINAIGIGATQLIISGYFLLTHINNTGTTGNLKILASINIFIASILFGLAYIKSKSIIMPVSMHFMANWTQGVLFGFGISGQQQESLLKPVLDHSPNWITGGNFGLEASIPGLICLIFITIYFYNWKIKSPLKLSGFSPFS